MRIIALHKLVIRTAAVALALMIGQSAWGQVNVFVSGGYQGNYMQLKPLNFVINRFNDTRTDLSQPMGNIEFLNGPGISLGIGGGNMAAIGHYKRYDKVQQGSWREGGNKLTTSLKLEANDYGIAFGAVPGIGNSITFGMGLEITFLDLTISAETPHAEGYEVVEQYLKLGFAPYAQLFLGLTDHLYIYLKPSYTLDSRFSDFYAVNEAINPATFQMDSHVSHEGKFNRLGLFAGIAFSFGSDHVGGR